MVYKFLGRPLSLGKVHDGLSSLWNPQEEWEIFPMSHGYFFFRFTSTSDLDRVLLEGPWALDDAVFALGRWSPDCRSSLALLPRTTVSMRLPDLPHVLWTRSTISLIVAAAGRLVRVDQATEL